MPERQGFSKQLGQFDGYSGCWLGMLSKSPRRHLGRVSVRKRVRFNGGGKTQPECGWHHPVGSDPRKNEGHGRMIAQGLQSLPRVIV